MRRVLLVEPEAERRAALAGLISRWGYEFRAIADGPEAVRKLIEWQPDALVAGVSMPNIEGTTLLRAARAERPGCTVILLSSHATPVEQAIGVGDGVCIVERSDLNRLRAVLDEALPSREVDASRTATPSRETVEVVGKSFATQQVVQFAKKAAPSNTSVVLTGDMGTGKSLLARLIHSLSPRSTKPFVEVDCAASAPELVILEIFGYERGAFAWADKREGGRAEWADRGTLFLDNVDCLPPDGQGSLLRLVREHRLRRCGATSDIGADVRVIVASTRDLKQLVAAGQFRQDLYFNLNVLSTTLPPLKNREGDVPLLVTHFIQKFNEQTGKSIERILPAAMDALERYSWPGNVRELQSVIERAVILADDEIDETHLPPGLQPEPARSVFEAEFGIPLRELEKRFILETLQRNGGNKTRTADVLGVAEKTLYNKLNEYAAAAARGPDESAKRSRS